MSMSELSRRSVIAGGLAAAAAGAAAGSARAASSSVPGSDRGREGLGDRHDRPDVVGGEGRSALHPERLRQGRDDARQPQPPALRRREPGRGRAEVPPRRCHLLRLDRQRAEPGPDRRSLQRPAEGGPDADEQGPDPPPDRDRPGAGRRDTHRAARHAVPRLDGPRGRPERRRRPHGRRDHRPRAARHGRQHELRPRLRRQRQPAQPRHRHPLLLVAGRSRRRAGRGAGRRLPA